MIIDFKIKAKQIGVNTRVQQFIDIIEALKTDVSAVAGFLPKPFLQEDLPSTNAFKVHLTISCLGLLTNLQLEAEAYKDITDKALQEDYLEIIDGFLNWYESKDMETAHDITLTNSEATIGNRVMQFIFAIKEDNRLVLDNIFCELGDITSRIMHSTNSDSINLTFGN